MAESPNRSAQAPAPMSIVFLTPSLATDRGTSNMTTTSAIWPIVM